MFKPFGEAVHKRYAEMARHELYIVDTVDVFASYLSFFPAGSDPVFRTRTEHDCSCCKQFVRKLGNLVAIVDGKIQTVWDDSHTLPMPYKEVGMRMAELIRQSPILTVFRTKERQYGTASNFDTKDASIRWTHFYGRVENKHFNAKPDEVRGEIESVAQVLRRGLVEIREKDVREVIDLIDANAIYRGAEHMPALQDFHRLLHAYAKADDKDLFIWANLAKPAARFRNTVIGTLLVDLAEGTDIERAVASFETKVAPQNYKRTSALITPRMVEDAVAKLHTLGLDEAIHRRYARMSDVSVNNVLFVDNAVKGKMKDGIAELLKDSVKAPTVNTKNAIPITMDSFLESIVPKAKAMQLLLQNTQRGNFVSITYGEEQKPLFRWNNNFAWSYAGEVTDSIKERVKRAGGRVMGAKLRVSLAWYNHDDLDLHCVTPDHTHIYFGQKHDILDVDMNAGRGTSREPVENMAWAETLRMKDGRYLFRVDQFQARESKDVGFALEVEAEGRIAQYSYGPRVQGRIDCLAVTVAAGKVVDVQANTALKGGGMVQDIWGVKTETLVPIETLMASPNHWDDQKIGNKHWFFILQGCKNPEATRGIYNEFLRADLEPHRKVFEVLGAKTKCPFSEEQLSGLGFSSTRNDHAIVVVDNGRTYDIKF